MTASDLLSALGPVVDVLDDLGVSYYVGGSLASSVHGVPRASIDADVIADLSEPHVAPFVARLQGAYYLDEDHVHTAIQTRRSFNLIHLTTMFKVDVFASKRRPFDVGALQRARPEEFGESPSIRRFRVASAEDAILAKLEWFRAGGEVSDRQWADILGVLRTVADHLDQGYLDQWAAALAVTDLLVRAQAAAKA